MPFSLRTIINACIGFVLVLAASYCAIGVLSILANSFAGFDGTAEFVDLRGPQAQRRMSGWPSNVDQKDVIRVSHKTEFSRDGYSTWYKIRLPGEVAKKWQDFIHNRKETSPQEYIGHLHEGYEGVHWAIHCPPPPFWQADATPKWWKPPAVDFRATEVMVWYKNFDSGVGQAVYSAFDPQQYDLWIYDYASQHHEFWQTGNMPDGEQFGDLGGE